MIVRPATEDDLPRLMGYADQFLAYHPITSAFPRDLEAVEAALRRMIKDENSALLVHDRGVIGGFITLMWCSPGVLVATELFWWAEAGGRSLMKAFEEWARERGADMVQMLMIMGRKDVSFIYDRAGYSPVELSYVRAA
jgi:GNAT superfamily N-acetyltransferase